MFIIEPIVTEMNKMLVASSLTLLMVTFMFNKVLTMVVVESNLMTVICDGNYSPCVSSEVFVFGISMHHLFLKTV